MKNAKLKLIQRVTPKKRQQTERMVRIYFKKNTSSSFQAEAQVGLVFGVDIRLGLAASMGLSLKLLHLQTHLVNFPLDGVNFPLVGDDFPLVGVNVTLEGGRLSLQQSDLQAQHPDLTNFQDLQEDLLEGNVQRRFT